MKLVRYLRLRDVRKGSRAVKLRVSIFSPNCPRQRTLLGARLIIYRIHL
jgi:hypothetical protein